MHLIIDGYNTVKTLGAVFVREVLYCGVSALRTYGAHFLQETRLSHACEWDLL